VSIGLICDRCSKPYLAKGIPTPGLCPDCITQHPAYKAWRTRP
jgi:hypothetical protein